ncbi:MAG: MBL fold metallo-hydrolase [Actinomycetota bacterium]|nr:MBL fold metallo-hydrolase [Actinomycetota bacterium]
MSEPGEIADAVEEVVDGVWHWRIHNANIGGSISSSQAVAVDGGCVLIDPVRLADAALATLPSPTAILLTATCHQRCAWRYRRELSLEVWLPEDARTGDEEPDRRYAEGDVLHGGLRAIRTPGPEWPHYSLLLEGNPGVLFCADLLTHYSDTLEFVPFEYHEDPEETRRSAELLLDLDFSILCLDHGVPLRDDPKAAIRNLLASTK